MMSLQVILLPVAGWAFAVRAGFGPDVNFSGAGWIAACCIGLEVIWPSQREFDWGWSYVA
jgi:uncharacterized membrane protein